jgi:hypothetical protein
MGNQVADVKKMIILDQTSKNYGTLGMCIMLTVLCKQLAEWKVRWQMYINGCSGSLDLGIPTLWADVPG